LNKALSLNKVIVQTTANMLTNGHYCTKCSIHFLYSLFRKEKNLMETFKLMICWDYFNEYAVIALKKYVYKKKEP